MRAEPKNRFFRCGERIDGRIRQTRSARCASRVITGRGKLSCTLICVSYVLVSRARAPRAVASGRRGVYLRSSVLSDALCKVLKGGCGVRRRSSTSAGDVFSLVRAARARAEKAADEFDSPGAAEAAELRALPPPDEEGDEGDGL